MKIIRFILLSCLMWLVTSLTGGEKLKIVHQLIVRKVITAVSSSNKKEISQLFNFPLARHYPVPPIKDKKEFIERFDEVFDQKLHKEIINSSVNKQWAKVGWRGIMFENGKVWIDEKGKIIAINHETEKQKKFRQDLIKKDRNKLHSSLKEYEKPILKESNKLYKFRVDLVDKKEHSYRLALWRKDESESSEPFIVLANGKLKFDGSGGNHYYWFLDKNLIYTVDVTVPGAKDSEEKSLFIEKRKGSLYGEN